MNQMERQEHPGSSADVLTLSHDIFRKASSLYECLQRDSLEPETDTGTAEDEYPVDGVSEGSIQNTATEKSHRTCHQLTSNNKSNE